MKNEYLIYCFFILLFSSCKKDIDNEPPIIQLSSPSEFSNYDVLDFIPVKATISDNKLIESVSIGVYNLSTRVLAFPSKTILVNDGTYSLETSIQISDSLLLSGNYYLRVNAFDGENRASRSSEIFISGIKRRTIEAIVSVGSNNSTELYSIKNFNNPTLIIQFGFEAFDIAINSYDQHLWIADKKSSRLLAYDLKRSSIEFDNLLDVNGQLNPFSEIKYFDRRIFVALKTGEIKGYNPLFTDVFTYFSENQGSYPEKLEFENDLILAAEKQVGTNNSMAVSIYNKTGAVNRKAFINGEILTFGEDANLNPIIFSKTPDSVLTIHRYSPDNGTKQLVFRRYGVAYYFATFLAPPYFLLIGDNGTSILNIQTTFLNNLTLSKEGTNKTIAYDDINKAIYIGQGNLLTIYSFPSGNLINQIPFQKKISSVDIRYNR